jgi:hypothetical protein
MVDRRRGINWRSLRMVLRRCKRNLARGLRKMRNSKLLGGRRIGGSEFPGEIYLESDHENWEL